MCPARLFALVVEHENLYGEDKNNFHQKSVLDLHRLPGPLLQNHYGHHGQEEIKLESNQRTSNVVFPKKHNSTPNGRE